MDNCQAKPEPFLVGLLWDEWTPQVESQLLRDVMALQDDINIGKRLVVSTGPEADRVLRAVDVPNIGPLSKEATFWRLYQTGESPPEAPEWATDSLVQILYQKVNNQHFLDKRDSEIFLPNRQRDVNYDPFARRPIHPGVAPESPWLVLL